VSCRAARTGLRAAAIAAATPPQNFKRAAIAASAASRASPQRCASPAHRRINVMRHELAQLVGAAQHRVHRMAVQ
jgi:hypothetical protein